MDLTMRQLTLTRQLRGNFYEHGLKDIVPANVSGVIRFGDFYHNIPRKRAYYGLGQSCKGAASLTWRPISSLRKH
jgi:hypothetical protein